MKLETILIFRDKKKFILYTLLILIALIALNVLLLTQKYINYYINKFISNKDINRIFSVNITDDNNKKELENIIYKYKNEIEYNYIDYDNIYFTYNDNEVVIKNIFSLNGFSEKYLLDDNQIIVSSGFLNRHSLKVGNQIEIYIENIPLMLKIIDYINSDDYRIIYMNSKMINNIVKNLTITSKNCIIKFKSINNIDNIISQFKNYNFNLRLYDSSGIQELEFYKSFERNITIIFYFISIILIAILYWIIKDIFLSERKNIAIKKLVGFNNLKCILDIFYKVLFYIMIGIIGSVIIIAITKNILLLITDNKIIADFCKNNLYITIWNYIIFIILYLISFLLNIKKIVKLNPILELNKE